MKEPVSRRSLLGMGLGLLALGAFPHAAPAAEADAGPVVTGDRAMDLLVQGNARYVKGLKSGDWSAERRRETAARQFPYASILGCADSRTTPEVFFDAGLGDLFVVRVAGNAITASNYGVLGSLEYSVAILKVPLLVIVGHTGCGAVSAALEVLEKGDRFPGSMEAMVQAIRPAAEATAGQPGDHLENAVRANVRLGKDRLSQKSELIAKAVKEGRLKLAGAVYDLASGAVTFL